MSLQTPLYTREFFLVFFAATLFMTGQGLQFHFAQYVGFLGHDVETLGRLTGTSMVASLLARPYVGGWIDRYGCRPIWWCGAAAGACAMIFMPFTGNLWVLGVFRALSVVSGATVMTAISVYITQTSPPLRRGEALGISGLGGFLGMMIGPTLGDLIFASGTDRWETYRIFFVSSAAAMALGGLLVSSVRFRYSADPATELRSGHSFLDVLLRRSPRLILAAGFVFSTTLTLNTVFLERFAEDRGFGNIKAFFLAYAPTAMILRVIFRRLPDRIGGEKTLLGGLLVLGIGVLCLIPARQEWHLAWAGMVMGAGHCFIFPAMVDLATTRLPLDKRGVGVSVIFAACDLGSLTGFILNGEMIDAYGYTPTLVTMSALNLLMALILAGSAIGFKKPQARGDTLFPPG